MKRTICFLILALVALAPSAWAEVTPPTEAPAAVVTLHINGMTTPAQVQEVEKTLSQVPGVQAVKASAEINEAVVIFNPLKAAKDQFMKDLKAAGYLASFASANFACPHCGAKYSKDGNCIVCDVPLLPNDVG